MMSFLWSLFEWYFHIFLLAHEGFHVHQTTMMMQQHCINEERETGSLEVISLEEIKEDIWKRGA